MRNLATRTATSPEKGFYARTLALLALAFLSLALLFAAEAGAAVKIVAPVTVRAGEPVHFAADAPSSTEEVTFYVDGQRRWVDNSPGWKFGRSGYVGLSTGRHVLKVRAIQPQGRVVVTTRDAYVTPPAAESVSSGATGSGTSQQQPPTSSPKSPAPSPAPSPTPAPAPAPSPAPAPAPQPSDLLFSGSHISDFGLQAAPGAITEVPDPAGSGQTTLKMTVDEGDVYPITPTDNPRAQALSPAMIHAGDEFWLQTKFMLPKDFPYVDGWMSLVSIYGPPFAGSSPWQIGVNESEMRWQRNDSHDVDIPWRSPVVKGQWVTILLHERFASDGWVEMWVNGQRITFFPPGNRNPEHEPQTDHLAMETMDSSNNGGANSAKIMQYRMAGMFKSTSVYFGALKVGKTRASVEA